MPIPRQKHFNIIKDLDTETWVMIPDDIPYDSLAVFGGRKTKVTIETID